MKVPFFMNYWYICPVNGSLIVKDEKGNACNSQTVPAAVILNTAFDHS